MMRRPKEPKGFSCQAVEALVGAKLLYMGCPSAILEEEVEWVLKVGRLEKRPPQKEEKSS